jgi:hypothetical protein
VLRDLPHVSGYDLNSIEGAPGFVDVPPYPHGDASQFDFTLRSDSPAIDAGGHLTRTSSDGSGTVVRVHDAGFFFDGFGTVSGDLIRVGNNPPVEIVNVDIANRRLTVGRSIQWSNGDTVSLNYQGTAPDIGAFEFGGPSMEIKPMAPVLAATE